MKLIGLTENKRIRADDTINYSIKPLQIINENNLEIKINETIQIIITKQTKIKPNFNLNNNKDNKDNNKDNNFNNEINLLSLISTSSYIYCTGNLIIEEQEQEQQEQQEGQEEYNNSNNSNNSNNNNNIKEDNINEIDNNLNDSNNENEQNKKQRVRKNKQERKRFLINEIMLLRIHPYPEHILKVISFAKKIINQEGNDNNNDNNDNSNQDILNYFNSIISPKIDHFSKRKYLLDDSLFLNNNSNNVKIDYLSALLNDQIGIKVHCHLMKTYESKARGVFQHNIDNIDDDKVDDLKGYLSSKIQPKKRQRKVTIQEKSILNTFEEYSIQKINLIQSTNENNNNENNNLSKISYDNCLDIKKTDLIESEIQLEIQSESKFEKKYFSTDDILNLPDNDRNLNSRRGPLNRFEYLNLKKYPQIDWVSNRLIEIINQSLPSLDYKIHIIDIGGGRGDLAIYLASLLNNVYPNRYQITVLDINSKSLAAGLEYAKQKGLEQFIHFQELNIRDFVFHELNQNNQDYQNNQNNQNNLSIELFRNNNPSSNEKVSFYFIGLHICGDLTDIAFEYLNLQIKQQMKLELENQNLTTNRIHYGGYLFVPCCYSKCCLNDNGSEDLISSCNEWRGWVKECNEIEIKFEFKKSKNKHNSQNQHNQIEEENEEKNEDDRIFREMKRTLCTLAESNPREYQWIAMKTINILRLCYLYNLLINNKTNKLEESLIESKFEIENDNNSNNSNNSDNNKNWKLTLESFPQEYSLRNIVLCGIHN